MTNYFKILKIPFLVLRDFGKFLLIYMPGGFGVKLRYIYYKNKFKKCGKNVIIDTGVHFDGIELISIGNNVHIDKYCIISTGKKLIGNIKRKKNHNFNGTEGTIVIGNDVHITQFCIIMGYGGVEIGNKFVMSSCSKIYSLTNTAYDLSDKSKIISLMPYTNAPFLCSPVVIKDNVWLGLNTIIMPKVTIGSNSFSVSNSVLSSDFEENSYISGHPAKKIRTRFHTNSL